MYRRIVTYHSRHIFAITGTDGKFGVATKSNLASALSVNNIPIPFESQSLKTAIVNAYGGETGGSTGIPGFRDEITYEQASAVENFTVNLGGVEGEFTQLRFFTKMNTFSSPRFGYDHSNISRLVFPESMERLNGNIFAGYYWGPLLIEFPKNFGKKHLVEPSYWEIGSWNWNVNNNGVTLKFYGSTPPKIAVNTNFTGITKILVPNEALSDYQAADVFKDVIEKIEGF